MIAAAAPFHPSPGTGAAGVLGGGSTCGHLVLPPNSPRQSLGVDDGATAASATPTRADASTNPRGSRSTPVAGSPIPFDLLLRGWR